MFDTKIAAWLCDSQMKNQDYSFATLLSQYLNQTPIGHGMTLFSSDLTYCMQLAHRLKDLIKQHNLTEALYQETRIPPILAKMEFVGIGFDRSFLRQYRQKLLDRMTELEQIAMQLVGHPILLTSPKQIATVLYEELKLKSPTTRMTTKKGHLSTSESTLKSLRSQHALVSVILEHRQIQKHMSMWIDALEQRVSQHENGINRIHSHWIQVQTVTGRIVSINPNLQALPKNELFLHLLDDKDEENTFFEDSEETVNTSESTSQMGLRINVRNAFCSRPGYTLIAADYSQIEFRILAHLSQDPQLIEFFNSGQDIHLHIASRLLGKPPHEVTKQQRDNAKRIVYGIIYGMGASSLARKLNTTVTQAEAFINGFLGKFPRVAKFIRDTVETAKLCGEVRTITGRIRDVANINSPDPVIAKRCERQAVNAVIQGSAADIIKMAMIQIDDALKRNVGGCQRAALLLQIHDELVYECEDSILENMLNLIHHYMITAFSESQVPLNVNLRTGKQYGSLTSVDSTLLFTTPKNSIFLFPTRLQSSEASLETKETLECTSKNACNRSPSLIRGTSSDGESKQQITLAGYESQTPQHFVCNNLAVTPTEKHDSANNISSPLKNDDFCSPDEAALLELLENTDSIKDFW